MKIPSNDRFDEIKDLIKEFPTHSGVYLMKSQQNKVIYVGKAKNLRNRVKSYFTNSSDHTIKTKVLVSHIHEIEYMLTKTEVEAFLLEASLIKKLRPKYNIRLKDDKSYPYIRLSWKEEFPRLYLARKVIKDGSLYFGPYTSGGAVFGTIRFLNRTFKIRDCTDAVFKSRTRPCMTYQIGRCTAPCVKYLSKDEYKADVEGALLFLKGKDKKVVKSLTERMMSEAGVEHFEVAARLRDSIQAIKAILQKQSVINVNSDKDQDAIGYFGDERGCLVATIHIRQGRVLGHRTHMLSLNPQSPEEDVREWLVSFINQYYDENIIPDEVLLPVEIGNDLTKLLEAVLKERAETDITVRFATDEKGRELVDMANQNAKAQFEKKLSEAEIKMGGLEEIQQKLNLKELPKRIECFDISHLQGSETVASQVVFEDGMPAKEHYRRYKIMTVEGGNNDYASMKEVLSRRFEHKEYEDPQLLVIDGGKGQLGVAVKVLEEIGRSDIPVVGLAKARTESDFEKVDVESSEERFFLPGRANPVTFKNNAQALHILAGIRDEAHRFAINYHRKLRDDRTLESELDCVVGLGVKRKKVLLTAFKSIEDIKAADPEEIARLKGFNRVIAERILLQLNEED